MCNTLRKRHKQSIHSQQTACDYWQHWFVRSWLTAGRLGVRKEVHSVSNKKDKLTFISWLISLFTGCAGFLLRLLSGGLPFSISGIVLVLAGSDSDQCRCASSRRSFCFYSRRGSEWKLSLPVTAAVIPGRLSPSSGASHHTSPLNTRALQAGGSAAEQSALSPLWHCQHLAATTTQHPVGTFSVKERVFRIAKSIINNLSRNYFLLFVFIGCFTDYCLSISYF